MLSENNSEIQDFVVAINKFGFYSCYTKGTSMEPLIHHQRDKIVVKKAEGELHKYDIPLYPNSNGKIVMHRIVKVCDDHYEIYGDNTKVREYVKKDQVIGRLVGFYKNSKKYIDLEKNKLYKLYSRIWVAILPLRPLTMFINRGIRYIKRHVFKMENLS